MGFRMPLYATVEIDRPTPPDTYAPIHADRGGVSLAAVGVAGVTVGALAGAGLVAARKLGKDAGEEKKEE